MGDIEARMRRRRDNDCSVLQSLENLWSIEELFYKKKTKYYYTWAKLSVYLAQPLSVSWPNRLYNLIQIIWRLLQWCRLFDQRLKNSSIKYAAVNVTS